MAVIAVASAVSLEYFAEVKSRLCLLPCWHLPCRWVCAGGCRNVVTKYHVDRDAGASWITPSQPHTLHIKLQQAAVDPAQGRRKALVTYLCIRFKNP